MKFWDASALIPLCLHERHSAALKRLAQDDESLVVWWVHRRSVYRPCLGCGEKQLLAKVRKNKRGWCYGRFKTSGQRWSLPTQCVNKLVGCCGCTHCGLQMHCSSGRLSYGAREIH